MPVTFDKVPPEVPEIVDRLIADRYPALAQHEIRIGYLYQKGGVKLHGYPCCATVKVCSLKDRKLHGHDVLITIDGDSFQGWDEWPEAKRQAVLDHELYHLTLVRDKNYRVKTDDLGRPKIKLRKHDFEIGGFAEICRRHGDAAVELQALRATTDSLGQLCWDWAEGPRVKGKGKQEAKTAARAMVQSGMGPQEAWDSTMGKVGGGAESATIAINGREVPRGEEAETMKAFVGEVVEQVEAAEAARDAADRDPWRKIDLSVFLPGTLADQLWERAEMATVGDVRDYLADGDTLEDLMGPTSAGLSGAQVKVLRAGLSRFRAERGGDVMAGLPAEWLTAPESTGTGKSKKTKAARATA
jgi:hypothetical protein